MTEHASPTHPAGRPWKPFQIFRLFSDEKRQRMLVQLVDECDEHYLRLLAELKHFRPATLRSLPAARKAAYVEEYLASTRLQPVLHKALSAHYLTNEKVLLSAFLDFWGIQHQDGQIIGQAAPPTEGKARAALAQLSQQFPRNEIAAYYATAGLHMGPEWQAVLWPAIPEDAADDTRDRVPTAPPAEERTGAEDAQTFTTLDNLVIKTVIAAIGEVDGAMSPDQAHDLVEEIIHLSSDRHRSYFHRGFLGELASLDSEQSLAEGNASRRAWLLSGRVMALVRKGDRAALRALYAERQADFRELMATVAARPAAVMVAPHIFEALCEVRDQAEAARAVTPEVLAAAGMPLVTKVLSSAQEMLTTHRTPEASLLIDLLMRGRKAAGGDHHAMSRGVLFEIDRRNAQRLRALGHFAEAEREFRQVVARHDDRGAADLHADIALCKGSFRWLSDVEIPRDSKASRSLAERLDTAAPHAKEALSQNSGEKTNAHFMLGVRALLHHSSAPTGPETYAEDARGHLEEAFAGMGRRPERYPDVLNKCRLYYALAILASLHEPQLGVARTILYELGEDAAFLDWPEWLLQDALQVIRYSPSEGGLLAEWLCRRFPRLAETFLDEPDILARSTALREFLRSRAFDAKRPADTRWKYLISAVAVSRDHGDLQGMRTALDELEEATFAAPHLRLLMIDLLGTQANYDPAWTYEEAQIALGQLLEAEGKYQEAALVLARLIHAKLSRGEVEDAAGLHERIKSFGGACAAVPDLDARFAALEVSPDPQASPKTESGVEVRVLFVGGNESQERSDAWVCSELCASAPGVEVTFVHSGWTSGWGVQAERIKSLMDRHEVIVIMRFVRTELGRRVRDDAGQMGRMWLACTGHGRESMLRSIVTAAQKYRSQSPQPGR